MTASARSVQVTTRPRSEAGIFFVSAVSFAFFLAGNGLGPLYLAAYLAIWAAYILAWPSVGVHALGYRVLWLFPALMLMSTAWSQFPDVTLRAAVELSVLTGTAIVAARAQSPRMFIASLMCALITLIAAGLVFGSSEIIFTTGETAQHGLFSSKNNFAMFNCVLLLSSLSVLADSKQALWLRATSLFGLLMSAALIILARSIGADLAVLTAVFGFAVFLVLRNTPVRHRPALLLCLVGGLLTVGVVAAILLLQGDVLRTVLSSVGKNTSLTGRSYLWQRGAELILKRPFFGLGYQAFWVKDYVEAEALWRYLHIQGRGGITFHNLSYETAVETGYVGLLFLLGTLAATAVLCFRWAVAKPDAVSGFFAALCIFFLCRVYVEVDFGFPFSHGTLLLPFAYVYGRSQGAPAAVRDARPGMRDTGAAAYS